MYLVIAAVCTFGAYVVNYVSYPRKTRRNKLVYQKSALHEKVIQEGMLEEYRPSWSLFHNPHVQILMTFLIPQKTMKYKRELFALPDGGKVALDWALHAGELKEDAPIVVVLHGLTGCSKSMKSFCVDAGDQGYRAVVFNKRGHGGCALETPRLQQFGDVSDLDLAIQHIHGMYPNAMKVGVGFSAGSGLLVSYLGETGKNSLLKAAVAVSPGYDAWKLFCSNGIHPVYERLMAYSVKTLLLSHKLALNTTIDYEKIAVAKTLRHIDEASYMKFGTTENIQDYWKINNPIRNISNIDVEVLCISASDDPVCTKEMIPYDLFLDHPKAMLAETEFGSHCGFYYGLFNRSSWDHSAAIQYLNTVLNEIC